MSINPYLPPPEDPFVRIAGRLSSVERRLAALERMETAMAVPSTAVKRTEPGGQNISNNTWTYLSFEVEVFDTDNMWSSAADQRLTFQRNGRYLVGYNVQWQASGTGRRTVICQRDDGSVVMEDIEESPNGTFSTYQENSRLIYARAGQYVRLQVFQNSAADLSILSNAASPIFWAIRIGA